MGCLPLLSLLALVQCIILAPSGFLSSFCILAVCDLAVVSTSLVAPAHSRTAVLVQLSGFSHMHFLLCKAHPVAPALFFSLPDFQGFATQHTVASLNHRSLLCSTPQATLPF